MNHNQYMNISKLIYALFFMLSLSSSSFATSLKGGTEGTKNTETTTNEFRATFSSGVKNRATATIENNKGTVIVTLTDQKGNILQERTIKSENVKYTILLESLPKGTYFLQVRGENKATYETYYVN